MTICSDRRFVPAQSLIIAYHLVDQKTTSNEKTHKNKSKQKLKYVRSGIRTHAYKSRLRPERSALDHSAILTGVCRMCSKWSWPSIFHHQFSMQKTRLIVVGFEPTPPKWLVPKTSALDHSATLPCDFLQKSLKTAFLLNFQVFCIFQYSLTAVGFEPTPPKWLVP